MVSITGSIQHTTVCNPEEVNPVNYISTAAQYQCPGLSEIALIALTLLFMHLPAAAKVTACGKRGFR